MPPIHVPILKEKWPIHVPKIKIFRWNLRQIWRKFRKILKSWPIKVPNLRHFGANFRKFWKIDPSKYHVFEKKGPIDVPGGLILIPMFAAHPYNHFCTEYPPGSLRSRLLCWISSCRQDFIQTLLSFHKEIILAYFLQLGNVLPMGELQIDAIKENFENFESVLFMKSVSMLLNIRVILHKLTTSSHPLHFIGHKKLFQIVAAFRTTQKLWRTTRNYDLVFPWDNPFCLLNLWINFLGGFGTALFSNFEALESKFSKKLWFQVKVGSWRNWKILKMEVLDLRNAGLRRAWKGGLKSTTYITHTPF